MMVVMKVMLKTALLKDDDSRFHDMTRWRLDWRSCTRIMTDSDWILFSICVSLCRLKRKDRNLRIAT